MKFATAIIFPLICGTLYFVGAEVTTNLDRLNIDSFLQNSKQVEYEILCMVYNGPCDDVGQELKRLLPQVGRNCQGCTADQKIKMTRIIGHIQNRYPRVWQDILRQSRRPQAQNNRYQN